MFYGIYGRQKNNINPFFEYLFMEVLVLKVVNICLASLLVLATSAFGFDDFARPYIGVTGGSAITSVNKVSDSSGSLNTDFDPGYLVGLNAGVTFDAGLGMNVERIRVELEAGYRSNSLAHMKSSQGQIAKMDGTVSVTNFMLNGYFENTSTLSSDQPINLFITAGVGAAMASISPVSYQGTTLIKSASDTQLAYQGGIGVGLDLTRNVTLEAAYKYMGTTTLKFAGVDAEYGSHNVLFGVRYSFK